MIRLKRTKWAIAAGGSFAWALWVTAMFTACLFGGGARADIASLVILRPVAAVICALSILTLRWHHWQGRRGILWMAAAITTFVAIQLIPLPPGVWQGLPGREILREVSDLAELGGVARPFSMAPATTWNALFSLLIPLAVLLSGVQLNQRDLRRATPVMAGLIVFSALLGMLQVVAGNGSPLYLYRITNEGTPVGLLANRNHQAFLLATVYPLLAYLAGTPAQDDRSAKIRLYACIFTALAITPVLLATGSRAGLLLGVLALASSAWIYRPPPVRKVVRRSGSQLRWQIPAVIFAVFLVASITVISGGTGLDRLLNMDAGQEGRLRSWPVIIDLGMRYFPWGSGVGTFVEVYRLAEPDVLLSPRYLNHAHNEVLEIWVTAGVPGIVLLLASLVLIITYITRLAARKKAGRLNKVGAIVVLLLLAGGLADYPLRTPALLAYFILAILWLTSGTDEAEAKPARLSDRGAPALS